MLNKVILMGRLCADPELRRTNGGTPVTSFTLAVERDYKNQNGEKETDFIDVTVWRNTAEFVSKFFSKGRMAVVEGSLQIREWEKDGQKRRGAEIQAENVYFADSRPADDRPYMGGGRRANDAEMAGGFQEIDVSGELPF